MPGEGSNEATPATCHLPAAPTTHLTNHAPPLLLLPPPTPPPPPPPPPSSCTHLNPHIFYINILPFASISSPSLSSFGEY
ncbi:hypothetical protein E2C01_083471 [Portunus trituberculatus]|uniref:Uncharacterized protein n=1 Tax=Portunus trituberculatus TaxID=210409 RepID=A0A5B7ISJ1_PORTR|nr:hypothetical protein [Portunus trituberculatus]